MTLLCVPQVPKHQKSNVWSGNVFTLGCAVSYNMTVSCLMLLPQLCHYDGSGVLGDRWIVLPIHPTVSYTVMKNKVNS